MKNSRMVQKGIMMGLSAFVRYSCMAMGYDQAMIDGLESAGKTGELKDIRFKPYLVSKRMWKRAYEKALKER